MTGFSTRVDECKPVDEISLAGSKCKIVAVAQHTVKAYWWSGGAAVCPVKIPDFTSFVQAIVTYIVNIAGCSKSLYIADT